jgi:hypothetical protein
MKTGAKLFIVSNLSGADYSAMCFSPSSFGVVFFVNRQKIQSVAGFSAHYLVRIG